MWMEEKVPPDDTWSNNDEDKQLHEWHFTPDIGNEVGSSEHSPVVALNLDLN